MWIQPCSINPRSCKGESHSITGSTVEMAGGDIHSYNKEKTVHIYENIFELWLILYMIGPRIFFCVPLSVKYFDRSTRVLTRKIISISKGVRTKSRTFPMVEFKNIWIQIKSKSWSRLSWVIFDLLFYRQSHYDRA